MITNLTEAITHCEEVAKKCNECAKEHSQLANWLKELQTFRENCGVQATYISNMGFYDACSKGHQYLVIDNPKDADRVIVVHNDLGGSSSLLREKFEFPKVDSSIENKNS